MSRVIPLRYETNQCIQYVERLLATLKTVKFMFLDNFSQKLCVVYVKSK